MHETLPPAVCDYLLEWAAKAQPTNPEYTVRVVMLAEIRAGILQKAKLKLIPGPTKEDEKRWHRILEQRWDDESE